MKRHYYILFFLSVTLPFSISGQEKGKKKDTFTFNSTGKDYTCRFDVLSEKENFPPKEDLTYYWYSTNKVLETKGGYDGRLLHGTYAAFYLNNNLKEKGEFKKGLKNKQWTSWYESGQVKELCGWKDGLKHGNFKSFDPNGKLVLEARFNKGRLDGMMRTYRNGELVDSKRFKNDQEVIPKKKAPSKGAAKEEKSGNTPKDKSKFWNRFKRKSPREKKDQVNAGSVDPSKDNKAKKVKKGLFRKKTSTPLPATGAPPLSDSSHK